ncbi:MAG TPA: hypothetical protein VNX21_06480, partial [Candidatus Thermoplasmatota archaeon]|nr:hypothetical protein [Candidatus Thermoplasmatota archaeon]
GLADASGRPLLDLARAAAEHEEGDQDVQGRLDDLLPAPLRAYEGGAGSYGGPPAFVVGKAVATLEDVKGFLGWDVAGPVDAATLAAARREVAEALRGVRGAGEPRLILLGMTF